MFVFVCVAGAVVMAGIGVVIVSVYYVVTSHTGVIGVTKCMPVRATSTYTYTIFAFDSATFPFLLLNLFKIFSNNLLRLVNRRISIYIMCLNIRLIIIIYSYIYTVIRKLLMKNGLFFYIL